MNTNQQASNMKTKTLCLILAEESDKTTGEFLAEKLRSLMAESYEAHVKYTGLSIEILRGAELLCANKGKLELAFKLRNAWQEMLPGASQEDRAFFQAGVWEGLLLTWDGVEYLLERLPSGQWWMKWGLNYDWISFETTLSEAEAKATTEAYLLSKPTL